jgi:small subunit ribosomal protein S2
MCDTNSNPEVVDYPIPGNDDAYKAVSLVTLAIGKAIEDGILERKADKDSAAMQEEEEAKRALDAGKEAAAAPVAVVEEVAAAEVATEAPAEEA